MKQLQQYVYTIPANGSVIISAANDNFIIQASTGALTVRGDTFGTLRGLVAGQGLKLVPFSRLELVDETGAPNTVTLLMTPAEFVNQVFSGSVSIVGALALDAATINALARPFEPNANFNSVAALLSNTPETIIAPGANVNGAIILGLGSQSQSATSTNIEGFVAKSSAPASFTDGRVVAQAEMKCAVGTGFSWGLYREQPIFLEAGLGLYYISSLSMVASSAGRYCRARLL